MCKIGRLELVLFHDKSALLIIDQILGASISEINSIIENVLKIESKSGRYESLP
jgi:hypothetical protein